MTKVAILQPSYLPWLGFFEQMFHADIFVYYDDVQYDKNGWRNRNRIKTANGIQWITVPVLHKGLGKQLISDIRIKNDTDWRRKHLIALKQAYVDALYVEKYFPFLKDILSFSWTHLLDLNIEFSEAIRQTFNINNNVFRSSKLQITGERTTRLLNICRYFDADTYYSGSLARNYLQVDLFEKHQIKVEWQNYISPCYRQQHGVFAPNLSVVDFLFNEGSALEIVF